VGSSVGGFSNAFVIVPFTSDPSTTSTSLAKGIKSTSATDVSAAAADAQSSLAVSVASVPGFINTRAIVQFASTAGGDMSTRVVAVVANRVPIEGPVPLSAPPASRLTLPTLSPSLAAVPAEMPLGPLPSPVAMEPAAILKNELLWKSLDNFKDQVVVATPGINTQVAGTVTIAVSIGTLVLVGPAIFWLLLAVSSRPLWKQFDPLEVLNDWEKRKSAGGAGGDDDETLQSMVERKTQPLQP
jgi:hypothetical protein